MPNYCYNTLQVKYTNDQLLLERFYLENKTDVEEALNRASELSFEKAVPTKEHTVDWHSEYWGTKWDAIHVECCKEDEQIIYYFETAWSPPCAWLDVVAAKYPRLRFVLEYSESGLDFWGKDVYENGVQIVNKSMDLSEYNWENVDKVKMLDIIEKHSQEPVTEENIDELTDIIMGEYGNADMYYENIESKIRELLEQT